MPPRLRPCCAPIFESVAVIYYRLGRGSHDADRNSGRLTIAQDSPHGSGAYIGRKKPVGRLRDTEAGKDRGALLFAVIAAKRGRRLIGYDPSAASEGPGSWSIL